MMANTEMGTSDGSLDFIIVIGLWALAIRGLLFALCDMFFFLSLLLFCFYIVFLI